jgi:hypothetical protein
MHVDQMLYALCFITRYVPLPAPVLQYLRTKTRAGVVALPPVLPSGTQRTLYLVPPSEEVCRQLGVSWQSCSDCLLALIVPMAPR